MNHAQRLTVADKHVARGELDEAAAVLDVLPPSKVAERLREVIQIFRRRDIPKRASHIARRMTDDGRTSFMLGPRDFNATLVIFTDMFGKFWVSAPVLAAWLAPFGCRMLFLRADTNPAFLTGESSILDWSHSIRESIHAIVGPDTQKLSIMGFSAGGFASLAVASQIPLSRHLGFSIRSNMNPASAFRHEGHYVADLKPMYTAAGLGREWDLRKFIAEHGNQTVSRIVAPLHNPIDQDHAASLQAVPGVSVDWIGTPSHNTVKECILNGTLDGYFQELLS